MNIFGICFPLMGVSNPHIRIQLIHAFSTITVNMELASITIKAYITMGQGHDPSL